MYVCYLHLKCSLLFFMFLHVCVCVCAYVCVCVCVCMLVCACMRMCLFILFAIYILNKDMVLCFVYCYHFFLFSPTETIMLHCIANQYTRLYKTDMDDASIGTVSKFRQLLELSRSEWNTHKTLRKKSWWGGAGDELMCAYVWSCKVMAPSADEHAPGYAFSVKPCKTESILGRNRETTAPKTAFGCPCDEVIKIKKNTDTGIHLSMCNCKSISGDSQCVTATTTATTTTQTKLCARLQHVHTCNHNTIQTLLCARLRRVHTCNHNTIQTLLCARL